MHHQKILVKPGDRVSPLQPIARGSGIGDQFAQPTAGGPHVHWQVKVDGKRVDPITGRPWDEIFPRNRR
jgi:murein DD-endopeptidase MepM/ murein hydrolase activator NlpD